MASVFLTAEWRSLAMLNYPIDPAALGCDAATLYGPAFAPALAELPRSAFVAEGSEAWVRCA